MTDHELVEAIQRQATSAIERWGHGIRPYFDASEIAQLAADWLAMWPIVQGLAASDPTGEDWQGGCTCPHCDEYRCDPDNPKPHGPKCPYGRAVALVGPAVNQRREPL